MTICPALPPGTGFIGSMTGYIDCQARVLGSGAWTALAAPGSTLSLVLAGFLTIFIALVGYNLLLGQNMTFRSGTLMFVKIGAIFALATSWPAYRSLVYDLVIDGPPQAVVEIGPQAGAVGADGTLSQRLDLADQAMAQLAILGPGMPPANVDVQLPPPPFGGFDVFALGGSRILFELTAVGGLGAARIVTGLMLALGPFFIAFLMFDATRSLFEGWVRVLAGSALAAVGVPVALGLELTLVEPWLGDALARRMAGEALPTISTELFVIVCLFSIIVVAAFYACMRVARAFRLAPLLRIVPVTAHRGDASTTREPLLRSVAHRTSPAERSRAVSLATIVTSRTRRDRADALLGFGGASAVQGRDRSLSSSGPSATPIVAVPVGRSFARRAHSRLSAPAARRDIGV